MREATRTDGRTRRACNPARFARPAALPRADREPGEQLARRPARADARAEGAFPDAGARRASDGRADRVQPRAPRRRGAVGGRLAGVRAEPDGARDEALARLADVVRRARRRVAAGARARPAAARAIRAARPAAAVGRLRAVL